MDKKIDKKVDLKKESTWLLNFKSNIYSQNGEDGIIKKILDILPEKDNWCVEFGAWDGIYLSNTRNLIKNYNYSGVLIEWDKIKFKELQKNYLNNPKIITLNRFVGFGEQNNLNKILKDTPIPVNFDFLFIDIDGNDYHVWKALSKYKPKVVCIKFNQTIPTEVRFIQKPDFSVSQGTSLLDFVELGKKNGYELVSILSGNAFFVKSEYYPLFKIKDNRPEILRMYLDDITYLFTGYDGKVFLYGSKKLPWHSINLKEQKIQALPKFLRKLPTDYSNIEKVMFAMYLLILYPHAFKNHFKRFVKRIKVHNKINN